ncbi:melanocyte-stimulating hormone receptor-like [Acropora palmata]|uniref:melanocyte-stimulating hormone receptor-like n=1 Tax=Acropora palmata TaxID=6131 RepID=UPI003DA19F3F
MESSADFTFLLNFNSTNASTNNARFDSPGECFHLPDAKFEVFHQRAQTNLVTGVVNAVLSPFAVVANILIVFVISSRASLQSPSNILFACLAISDLQVGILVQPSYVAYRLLENAHGFVPCAVRMLYSTGFYVYYGVSFTTLSAVSCERLLALIFHLRYYAYVRPGRVLKTAIFIWFVNILFTTLQWANNSVFRGIHLAMWTFFLAITFIIQIKILQIITRHQRQIKKHRPTSAQRQMQVKLAINIASIVAVYVMFNLPVLLVTLSHQFLFRHIYSYNFYSWTETAAFVNSSLNPLVCIWRVKAIRKAIAEVLSKLRRMEMRQSEQERNEIKRKKGVFLVKFTKIAPLENLKE